MIYRLCDAVMILLCAGLVLTVVQAVFLGV